MYPFKKKELEVVGVGNKTTREAVVIYGAVFYVEKPVYNYIHALQDGLFESDIELRKVKHELEEIKHELEEIKPVVESKNYKPAISEDCLCCKYVIRSTVTGNIIGCRKDNVCEDFVKESED